MLRRHMARRLTVRQVVWQGCDGTNCDDGGNDFEIFLYDGETTTQLTDNSYDDVAPQISGSNVVWRGAGDIFVYDGR